MPHEIDVSTGSAAVLVAGEPPWHGLGTVIQHAAGSQQALQLAHLDWTVESSCRSLTARCTRAAL